MNIFIYGPDTYRSQVYLKKIIEKFKKDRDPSGYNTIVLDCLNKDDAVRVLQEVLAAPFLAERRMVVLKQLISCKDVELKKQIKERIEQHTIPETNVLVVYETEEKFRAKADKELLALLQKEKYKEYFGALEGRELSAWIVQEIKNAGGTIDQKAVQYLTANAADDMWGLANAINQLVALALEQTISLEQVKLFVKEKVDDNIFNLVDAIVAGQKKKAFSMMRAQYGAGNDSGYVFAMILRQFRILLQIKDALDRGMKPDAKAMGLHPFVLKKTMPMVQRYEMDALQRAYKELLEIDIKTKTGGGDQKVMLDMFVGAL